MRIKMPFLFFIIPKCEIMNRLFISNQIQIALWEKLKNGNVRLSLIFHRDKK